MKMTSIFSIYQDKSVPRDDFLHLLNTSRSVGTHQFTSQAALLWLAHYPGDLQINLLYAQSLMHMGLCQQAIRVFTRIWQTDPEYLEALLELTKAKERLGDQTGRELSGNVYILGGDPGQDVFLPDWAYQLREARTSILNGQLALAEDLIHQVLTHGCPTPLAALLHLEVVHCQTLPSVAMRDLALHYHHQLPECLGCTLWIAESLMNTGDTDQAVALLHETAARDVAGQVVTRLWGPNHPYRSLWSSRIAAPLDIAAPAALAAALGWNQLPRGRETVQSETGQLHMESKNANSPGWVPRERLEIQKSVVLENKAASDPEPGYGHDPGEPRNAPPSSVRDIPETLRDIQEELERVAERLKQNHIARSDGRFPVYVVLSTRQGLKGLYGSRFEEVDSELKRLVAAVGGRDDWRALLLYADDSESTATYNITPAKARDPWELKLVLADLDSALAKQGEMIGAVLIVGGPEVVPFHHLPNPVDDADMDAPSDNPYATRDENYFVPEWLVGRLPGGAQSNPEPLLAIIRGIAERHQQYRKHHPWYRRWLIGLTSKLWFINRGVRPSWGYTAAVWRRAAMSVFRPIGAPHTMLVSPPVQVNGPPGRLQKNQRLPTARLGYFNLHGLEDASEWYGQRDPTEPEGEIDYPVALRPEDVMNGGRAPQVVFTEACYGAHIIGRKVDEALALKFLESGSQAVVGSTVTAYGSITPPLIAADLLGHTFWRYLREGIPAGEAFRRAKIHLAREMLHRQGYLDGEDQKTLITFVYYGDPLAEPSKSGKRAKAIYRPLKRPKSIKTVCDLATRTEKSPTLDTIPPIPSDTLTEVKRIVEQYLPGMRDANVLFAQEHANCPGGMHTCPTSQLGSNTNPSRRPERSVVTLSKQINPSQKVSLGEQGTLEQEDSDTRRVHWHYARLTLDQKGHIVKLAVSR